MGTYFRWQTVLVSSPQQKSFGLRGIKDWVCGFWDYKIWINYMPNEEAWHNVTVTSFQATPINSLPVPSPSLRVYQYNKLDMRTFCKQNFMIVSTPLRQLAQLFIHGNSGYLFPKCLYWQICHTHQAFKLPLRTFSSKLRIFPTVKSKTIGFLLDLTQQYSPIPFPKTPRELLPEKELLSDIMSNLIMSNKM